MYRNLIFKIRSIINDLFEIIQSKILSYNIREIFN
jgi:hypothetical protein